ncbi:MAG: hypothetical protein A2Y15_07545 [Clostridiales bacterium GWF2_36_10]|nr:MAG: hypothetical protein A2Y15_07545 [Clostridiales bacterium GWF2_36_10]
MNSKLKTFIALLLALLLILPMVIYFAMSGENSQMVNQVAAADNPITVCLNETDYMMQQFILAKLKEQYPDIKVNLTMARNDDSAAYYNSVKDSAYDVFTSPEGYFDTIVASGTIATIEKYLATQKFDDMVCGGAIQDYEDGHIYTIPYEPANYTIIFYNRQIFEQYDLTVPKTAEQFLEVCEVLKSNGVPALATSATESWESCMFLEALALTVDPDISKKIVRGRASFGDLPYTWAAEFLRILVDNNYIETKFLNQSYADNSTSFVKGEVAMFVDGSWSVSDKATKSVNKSGWFFAPVKEEKYLENYGISSGSSMKIGNGFLISKACKDKTTATKIGICIAAAYAEYRYQYGDTTATVYKADELGWEIQSVTPYFGVSEYMSETQKIEHMYPYLQDMSNAGGDICLLIQKLMRKQIDAATFTESAKALDGKGRVSY